MKFNLLILLAFTGMIALFHTSCSLTPAQKETLTNNLLKDGNAALVGGLTTGTWQGAAAGAGAQVIQNHVPKTAAKQPVPDVLPK